MSKNKTLFLIVAIIATIIFFKLTNKNKTNFSENITKAEKEKIIKIKKELSNKNQIKKIDKQINKQTNIKDNIEKNRYEYSELNNELLTILEKVHSNKRDELDAGTIYETIQYFINTDDDLTKEYKKIYNMYLNATNEAEEIFLISFLGNIDTKQSVKTLLSIMDIENTPSLDVKINITKALNDLVFNDKKPIKNRHLSKYIEEYLKNKKNTTYRIEVATTLAKIGEESAMPLIVNEINSANYSDKVTLLRELSNVENENVTKKIITTYKNLNLDNQTQQMFLKSIAVQGNDVAVKEVLGYALNASADDIETVENLFKIVKDKNENIESLIGDKLFNEEDSFNSYEVKEAILNVFDYKTIK